MMPYRPTLALLMEDLARSTKVFRDFCMDGDKISRRVNILVNGHHMLHLQKDDTRSRTGRRQDLPADRRRLDPKTN